MRFFRVYLVPRGDIAVRIIGLPTQSLLLLDIHQGCSSFFRWDVRQQPQILKTTHRNTTSSAYAPAICIDDDNKPVWPTLAVVGALSGHEGSKQIHINRVDVLA